ncbi:MAG TPA: S8 family serine peptidase [Candidatus Baltobacteraceae bacterium]|nr:S8 family serine peptidase [Candidatus Baltobacteraceae bacterium]
MSRSLRAFLAILTAAGLLAGCGGGGGGGGSHYVPNPNPTPVGTATGAPTSAPSTGPASAYVCPANDSGTSVARASLGEHSAKAVRGRTRPKTTAAPTMLAVTYSAASAQRSATALTQRETAAGAQFVRSFTFSHLGTVTHIVAVPSGSQVATVEAALRKQSGVVSVATAGARRRPSSVTTTYWPNDPYFDGFTAAQNTAAGNPAPSTFEALPYAESSLVPGQWNMHAIQLEHAFAYSQSGNGSGITAAGALGSSSVKIAVIDTGEDPNHPELKNKIVYQKCFITAAASPYTQSTSNYETDPDGHGTDVAGLAAAQMNNGLGFTGAGGNVVIYGYRVYPTPDDNCDNDNNNDDQCGASTTDIASAIEDAVAQHVNVITMSLGGDACSPAGVDEDTTEGAAVADAIKAGIIVTAAAGNSYGPPVEAPACDSGVIAVGATSLDDGTQNGSGTSAGGSATTPKEYVATYTDYGSPGAAVRSASAWGIVAPGGDPWVSGNNYDQDDLHWIEDIWTSTPFMANSSDTTFEGNCSPDYASSSSTDDCRTLIAGTSMATPTVAGAAALILSATGGSGSPYQSPSAMRSLLCSTADDISDPNEGCGRLNVYRAMAKALGDPHLP